MSIYKQRKAKFSIDGYFGRFSSTEEETPTSMNKHKTHKKNMPLPVLMNYPNRRVGPVHRRLTTDVSGEGELGVYEDGSKAVVVMQRKVTKFEEDTNKDRWTAEAGHKVGKSQFYDDTSVDAKVSTYIQSVSKRFKLHNSDI